MSLESGCHVFCEKPLADGLAQADTMVRTAAQAGRLVVVNNQFPYMRIHLAAKQQIGTPGVRRTALSARLAYHASPTRSAKPAGAVNSHAGCASNSVCTSSSWCASSSGPIRSG